MRRLDLFAARPIAPSDSENIATIQAIATEAEANFIPSNLPHVTMAKGSSYILQRKAPLRKVPPIHESMHRELVLPVKEVTVLGRTPGEAAFCLLLDDPEGQYAKEHQFIATRIFRQGGLETPRPHVTIGTIKALYATTELLSIMESSSPEKLHFNVPYFNTNALKNPSIRAINTDLQNTAARQVAT